MNIHERNALVSAALDKHQCPALMEEIEYRLNVDSEQQQESDLYNALLDTEDWAVYHNERLVVQYARRALIELGVYVHIPDSELQYMITNKRGKKHDFALDGKKYIFDRHIKVVDENGEEHV